MKFISISGAQGSGKSSLLSALRTMGSFDYFHIMEQSLSNKLVKDSVDLNVLDKGEKQKRIFNAYVDDFYQCKERYRNLISDRSIVDALAYSLYHHRKNVLSELTFYREIAQAVDIAREYDNIFILEPTEEMLAAEIEDNGVRSTDKDFQAEMIVIFRDVAEIFKDVTKVTIIKRGDIFKRSYMIQEAIFSNVVFL